MSTPRGTDHPPRGAAAVIGGLSHAPARARPFVARED